MPKYSAIVIGLGRIGIEYDLCDTSVIQTHVNALISAPHLQLVAGVDKRVKNRELLHSNHCIPAYRSVKEAAFHKPDIVAIATPASEHLQCIIDVLEICKPKLILCEKPLSDNLEDAKKILKYVEESGVRLIVNYIRRFEPGVLEIKGRIGKGELGNNVRGVAYYTKGLIENGSHMTNLLEYWFGDPVSVTECKLLNSAPYFGSNPDIVLEYKSCAVTLVSNPHNQINVFEVELVGSKGRVSYKNCGHEISWSEFMSYHDTRDHRVSEITVNSVYSDLNNYQRHVYKHVDKYLRDMTYQLPSSGQEAYQTLKNLSNWI